MEAQPAFCYSIPVSLLDQVEFARGYFDRITIDEHRLAVDGWMLRPEGGFTRLTMHLDGEQVATMEPLERDDLANIYAWIPNARRAGFRFEAPWRQPPPRRLDVIGYAGNGAAGRMTTVLRAGFDAVPVPPLPLIQRVIGAPAVDFFRTDGLKCFSDFLLALRRHREPGAVRRMLDWGCGCGRLTVHFLADGDIPEVHGCDIDAEAVAWCAANLTGGHFTPIEPWPPAPYADGFFDVVIGFSVLTHLERRVQEAWLEEMRRIIAPGGLFLASIHGEFATRFALPQWKQIIPPPRRGWLARWFDRRPDLDVARHGIIDGQEDPTLSGVAPDGYYRAVLQSRAYTERQYARYFDVIEYIERGAGNHHDLVVMRRPSA
jgi:SAM-dependent methyltransferase